MLFILYLFLRKSFDIAYGYAGHSDAYFNNYFVCINECLLLVSFLYEVPVRLQ